MKTQNILLFLLIVLINSCSSEEHLKFENVPINGNRDKFVREMIKLGFTEPQSKTENPIKLNGIFLDKKCAIYVWGTGKSHTAYKIRVDLPVETLDSLRYSFEKLQKLYTSIYGSGKSRYQQYKNPERLLFNEPRLTRRIKKGDFTRFTTDSGYITIEVQEGYLTITYLDKSNNEKNKKEMK
jgi:hypothetical protein